MPLKESEAIILRSFPLGEGDRVISFLDRNFGRLRGVARGARLPKSRFGSTLELLSHVRIWYFEREDRDLVRINQCELIESFLDVQQDYENSIALALLSEVTEAVLAEREVVDPQFRLLLLCAKAIRSSKLTKVVLAYFCLWTVRLGGWLGPVDACMKCGRAFVGEAAYFSSNTSGFVCLRCRDEWMASISPEALRLASRILSAPLATVILGAGSGGGSDEIFNRSIELLEIHLERKIKTKAML